MRKALFLDRDGVINFDYGYVHQVSNFKFIDGIFNLSQQAVLSGYLILVITNQAGIGRGFYTLKEFEALSENDQLRVKTFLDGTGCEILLG